MSSVKPKIVNPYAKKKSTVSSASATASAPVALKNQTSSNGKIERSSFPVLPDQRSQLKPAPPRDVDPSSTFSQAFGDCDLDTDFGIEERSEQLKFDQALASSEINTDDTKSMPQISDRDNQQFLAQHVLHVSTRQQGNPVLQHIRNVPFQQSKMVPDYIFAHTRCALFLSLRYHNLHPTYIHRRIRDLGSDFDLRILLCHVDVDDNANVILFLNDLCVQNSLTLILAWSEEEAARYLETFKAFDGKDASLIQKREHSNYPDQVTHALGSVRSVNKTDASQLLTQFGTWKNLVAASVEELSVCPGVGVKKVRRLYEAFHRPFSNSGKKRKRKENENAHEESKLSNSEKDDDTKELEKLTNA